MNILYIFFIDKHQYLYYNKLDGKTVNKKF